MTDTRLGRDHEVKKCTFDKFAIIRKFYCIIKCYVVNYFLLLEEDNTVTGFVFEICIFLYFSPEENDWKGGRTLGNEILEMRSPNNCCAVSLVDILEYWETQDVI